ncbi:hypothetical protein GCM10027203_30450 [Nonomuraea fastidiosa]
MTGSFSSCGFERVELAGDTNTSRTNAWRLWTQMPAGGLLPLSEIGEAVRTATDLHSIVARPRDPYGHLPAVDLHPRPTKTVVRT